MSLYSATSCGTTPRQRRAAMLSFVTEWPITLASPESGGSRPEMTEITVLLPAPFRPEQAEHLAPAYLETDAALRDDLAEGLGQVADLDCIVRLVEP